MAQKLSDRQTGARLSPATPTSEWRLVALAILALGGCSSQPPIVTSPPAVTTSPTPSPLANEILFRAISLVGTPYHWGGNTPESGFDCSGLIGYVYRDVAGISLPRTTRELMAMATPKIERNALAAGDLLFFATGNSRSVSHAGIYVGDGRFVHAPSKGGTVRLDQLSDRYWDKSYLGARRVLIAQ